MCPNFVHELFRWINEMKRGAGPTQFYQRVVFWWSDERWEATEWQRAAEDVSVGVLSRGWLPSWQECAWEIEELVFICGKTFRNWNWAKLACGCVKSMVFFRRTQTFHQTDVHANIYIYIYLNINIHIYIYTPQKFKFARPWKMMVGTQAFSFCLFSRASC